MCDRIKISVDIDTDHKRGLVELSTRMEISFSECCRQAIAEYLALNKVQLNKLSDLDPRQVSIKECCEDESTIED